MSIIRHRRRRAYYVTRWILRRLTELVLGVLVMLIAWAMIWIFFAAWGIHETSTLPDGSSIEWNK